MHWVREGLIPKLTCSWFLGCAPLAANPQVTSLLQGLAEVRGTPMEQLNGSCELIAESLNATLCRCGHGHGPDACMRRN